MKNAKKILSTLGLVMSLQFGCELPKDPNSETVAQNSALNSKADLLNLLNQMSGNQILSGQESTYWDQSGNLFPTTRDTTVRNRGGDYPALFSTDFGDFHNQNGRNDAPRRSEILDMIKAYHDQGSIIMLNYHLCPPDLPDGCGFNGVARPRGYNYPSYKIDQILEDGTSLNREHMRRLDEIADYLLILQQDNIPVMWRPFHEMNGAWFWWGESDRYIELYRQMYRHFESRGVRNALWVWSPNYWSPNEESPRKYYPGDAYVDVLAPDIYVDRGHEYDKRIYDEMLSLGNGKPIGIGENATMPDWPTLSAEQPRWAFFCTWWGYEAGNHNTQYNYDRVYGDSRVLTLGDMQNNSSSGGNTSGNNTNNQPPGDGVCRDDGDGDRFGWNGTETCERWPLNNNEPPNDGVCRDDGDGDRYGWNGSGTCERWPVNDNSGGSNTTNHPPSDGVCRDDGDDDRYGWNGSGSCERWPSNDGTCLDDGDGDRYGWNGVQSCIRW